MYLKHISHTDSSVDTLATDIEIAATWCTHIRGLMFRRDFSVGSALVFQFDRVTQRTIHMLFVYSDIDVLWLKDDIVIGLLGEYYRKTDSLYTFKNTSHMSI